LNTPSQHQTLHSFQWSFIEKVGKVIFQLAQIALLTRFLSKNDFGLVALALVSIEFSFLFVDAGLNAAILHIQHATDKVLSSVYWLNIFLSLILFGALWAASPWIALFYEEPALELILPILGANIILLAIGRQHKTYLQKQFLFKPIALIEISAYITSLLLAVYLALEGYGVFSLVYSALLASLIANLCYLFLRLKQNPIHLHFRWSDVKPFVDIGKFQMGSRLLDFISKETDVLIIGKILGMEVLGLYSLTKQLVLRLFNVVNPIITNVLSPWLASLQQEPKKQKTTYLLITRYLAYLNFPLYLVFAIGSFEILYVIYGPSYTSGSLLLFTLSIYFGIISITNPVGSLQIATGRTDIGFYWTLLRASITPAALLIGIYLGGIQGVAYSLLILALGLIYPLWFVQIRTMIGVSFSHYLKEFYRPLISFLTLALGIHFGLKPLLNTPDFIAIGLSLILAISLQIGLIYLYDSKTFSHLYSLVQKNLNRN
jgi:O-antigen/teichoic acid export membrane protein